MAKQEVVVPKEKFTSKTKLVANAKKDIDTGPVTETYVLNVKKVLELLNNALASEWICILRYLRHYYAAKGLVSSPVQEQFMEHAKQEQHHAELLSERISQLGGDPNLNPSTFAANSVTSYSEGKDLCEMIREDLIGERIVIDFYREFILYVGDYDPTTKRMLEKILSQEEDHADDLATLLEGLVGDKQ